MDDQEQKVFRDIDEYGLHVKLILEGSNLPGWAFSVGLYERFQHPEILLFGLPKQMMHQVLNHIAEDIKQGRTYMSGFEYADILEGVTCIFHSIDQNWYQPFLGWATWFYDGDDFPVLQCIWSDKEQNYPWSARFPAKFRSHQPYLFRHGVEEARVEGFLRSVWESHCVDEVKEITALRQAADSTTSACKLHDYDPNTWPFDNPKRINVLAPQDIIDGSLSIGNVFHDASDVWLIYPRSTKELSGEAVDACLGCLFALDSSLGDIADLPRDWEARRKAPEDPWIRCEVPDE